MELIKKLNDIQRELKAPKNQFNKFGNYAYRNAEDILEAVKPLLKGVVLTLSDEIVQIGDRFYVKAKAKITDGKNIIENTAYAREAMIKRGMDDSQITGAASSYARKYALNGLFLIDDTRDADSEDNREDKNPKGKDAPKELIKVGSCSICGQQAIKCVSSRTGKEFYTCPDWQTHQKNKEAFKIVAQNEPLDKASEEFMKSLK